MPGKTNMMRKILEEFLEAEAARRREEVPSQAGVAHGQHAYLLRGTPPNEAPDPGRHLADRVVKAIERLEASLPAMDSAFMTIMGHPRLTDDEKHDLGKAIWIQWSYVKGALRKLKDE